MSRLKPNIDLKEEIEKVAEKAIEAFKLSYDKTAHSNLHDPLIRWCDFLLRYIPKKKRSVYKSDCFPVNIHEESKIGLQRIEELFINGGGVNAYQSKTLTLFNDTSGKREKKRTDGLWADWGIHHLHLPLEAVSPLENYSKRSEWILFLKVYDNAVLFIDIKSHNNNIEPNLFSQQDLMRTFIRNWPQEAEAYQMRGVVGLSRTEQLSDTDIGLLRNNGVNIPFEFEGKVYAPFGMGMTTAVTSTRVTVYSDRIYHYAEDLETVILDVESQFMKKMNTLKIDDPKFQIMMFDDGGLGIHEERSNKAWKFPRESPQTPNVLFVLFNNNLMPEWAGRVVAEHWKKSC